MSCFRPSWSKRFGGPRHGLHELRRRVGAPARALTCSALKPQGLPPAGLADLALRFARGRRRLHQGRSRARRPGLFAVRARGSTRLRRRCGRSTPGGKRCAMCRASRAISTPCASRSRDAARAGVDTVMVAPMIAGLVQLPPAGARASRRSPSSPIRPWPGRRGSRLPLLLGKLFRVLGADAVVFPNYGGRFGYSPDTCRALAARRAGRPARPAPGVPVPAGGMTTDRVPRNA